jgi:hypothetical protein
MKKNRRGICRVQSGEYDSNKQPAWALQHKNHPNTNNKMDLVAINKPLKKNGVQNPFTQLILVVNIGDYNKM